jgi:glycosyltransferase involved in cell wall biosynthesis
MKSTHLRTLRMLRDTPVGRLIVCIFRCLVPFRAFNRQLTRVFGIGALKGTGKLKMASDRGPAPTVKEEELRSRYQALPLAAEPDTFVLYRIIGNDLVPRHRKGQSRENLRFILENEPELTRCQKRWVVNRIADPEEEAAVIASLESHKQPYLHIPFTTRDYALIGWDLEGLPEPGYTLTSAFDELPEDFRGRLFKRIYRYKNNYLVNNNGARNAAVKDGRGRAKWVLPWDGNCFVTGTAWDEIRESVEQRPWFPYGIVPMARITDPSVLLGPEFRPEAREEPQILFRHDAAEVFNEEYYYGRRPKVELLWRLGVPGPWDDWALEPWDLPVPDYSPDAGAWQRLGWVVRLPSGKPHLDAGGGNETRRLKVRADALTGFIEGLDAGIIEENLKNSLPDIQAAGDPHGAELRLRIILAQIRRQRRVPARRAGQRAIARARRMLQELKELPFLLDAVHSPEFEPELSWLFKWIARDAGARQLRASPDSAGTLYFLLNVSIAVHLGRYREASRQLLHAADRAHLLYCTKGTAPDVPEVDLQHREAWIQLDALAWRCGIELWKPPCTPPFSLTLDGDGQNSTTPRIVHISTVHSAQDPRIRLKQLGSLRKHGFDAHLISADHQDSPKSDGVKVFRIAEKESSRLKRMFVAAPLAVWRAFRTPASVYHFHDPELLPWAWLLLLRRVPVVYDVHEDYTLALSQKNYLPRMLRRWGMRGVGALEKILSRPFKVVLAEKCYKKRFPQGKTVLNYPPLALTDAKTALDPASRHLLYTGNLTPERGAFNMARLIAVSSDIEITLAGRCPRDTAESMRKIAGPGADRLHFTGLDRYVPFSEIQSIYSRSDWLAGIVLISDSPHYREKQLTKFFEYMAMGLPIIASDFPAWRHLIQDQGLGICVDPEDSAAVLKAVERLQDNPEETRAMGLHGRERVRDQYHWEREAKRLISLYGEYYKRK